MDWSEVLNVILGGGLAATIIGIVTLRSTIRKAKADAEKAKAEANTVNITVAPDQYSLAIGKRGQNVRLTSKLVGWHVEVKKAIFV